MYTFTVYDLLAKNQPGRADQVAVVDGERQVTYGQLAALVDEAAAILVACGVGRGDRVCVQLLKSVDEIVAMFAAARIGAVFVNINHRWTSEQVVYVATDCAARALFTSARAARKLAKLGLPAELQSVIVRGKAPDHPSMQSWEHAETAELPAPRGIDADLAAILYTSGSSGPPKGVMLSNLNLVQGARAVARYVKNQPADRLLSMLPFSFDYGLNQLTTMCLLGGTVVLQPVMMATEVVKTLVEQEITGFAAVPPAWISIVRYLKEQPVTLPHLRYVTNSGGKIPDDVLELMPRVFAGTEIYLMYGLTEAFRSTYLPPERFADKMGSMGKAIPDVEIFVVDADRGICGPGEQGELVHRGSLISMGYWGKPDLTAEKFRVCPHLAHLIGEERVLFSGDIVRVDDDGFLWFVGRRDGMIKASGFRISPTEVEDIVSRSGMVEHVIAFGVADELNGQAVAIAYTSTDECEAELVKYCRANMPNYMVPRDLHRWAGELPRTASGKIDRPAVIGLVSGDS